MRLVVQSKTRNAGSPSCRSSASVSISNSGERSLLYGYFCVLLSLVSGKRGGRPSSPAEPAPARPQPAPGHPERQGDAAGARPPSVAPLSSNDVVCGGDDGSSSSTLEDSKRGCNSRDSRDHNSKAGTAQWRLPPRCRLLRPLYRTAMPKEMNNRTARLLATAVQLQSLQPPKLKEGAGCLTWEITAQ